MSDATRRANKPGTNAPARLRTGARRPSGRLQGAVFAGCAFLAALAVAFIFCFLAWFSLPLFSGGRLAPLFTWVWNPMQNQFGILPMAVSSLMLAATAMLGAYPAAVGLCFFMHGLGPSRLAGPLMSLVRFMTAVPTVAYGFVAAILLTPLLRQTFASGTGYCWLAASMALSVLILPTITLIVDGRFSNIAPGLRTTGEALGLSRSQILLHLVLPQSRRALIAAAALGFGRAAGDAVIALMLSGNAARVPHSPLDSMRVLAAHIALVLATDSQSEAYASLFACGLLLFAVIIAVNAVLRLLDRESSGGPGSRG